MATASVGGNNGSAMGNTSQGTRGLSAGDWTRIQRLRGAKPYGIVSGAVQSGVGLNNITSAQFALNSDINTIPGLQQPYGPALLTKPVVGTSKIRRTASSWTDFVASQHADFYTQSQALPNGPGVTLALNQVGSGLVDVAPGATTSGTAGSLWANKPANPVSNAFNRLKILS